MRLRALSLSAGAWMLALFGGGCNCSLPAAASSYAFTCPDSRCPTGEYCDAGLCLPESSGTGSSSGGSSGSGGSTTGGSSGGNEPGDQCSQNSDCASDVCLGYCCKHGCAPEAGATASCLTGVFCSSGDGACHYPSNGFTCAQPACDADMFQPEAVCADGACLTTPAASCPAAAPVCDSAGTGCVVCTAPGASACPSGDCCHGDGTCQPITGTACVVACLGDGGACSAAVTAEACCTGYTCCAVGAVGVTVDYCVPSKFCAVPL
jgi:hypothetical protein